MIEVKYRPDVDGLRAVAVALVLFFHSGLGFSGGFVGVDMFFVVSGFLITGLITKQQDAGTFTLSSFWVRRIRRIIPAATVMVVCVLVSGYFLLLPSDYADLGRSALAQQSMLSNVYFWQSTGYFDGPAELKPLLHTWSLAVEEQFYLGYPLLLMISHRLGRRPTVIILCIVGLSSLIMSEYGVTHHPSATFFLLPTRAWELVVGGLICFLPRPSIFGPKILASVSWFALAATAWISWSFNSMTPFPGVSALIPCLCTAAFIYVNAEQLTLPAAILASRPLVFLGLISYSLYLWHWPILAFLRYRFGSELSDSVTISALAAAVVLSIISWRFVETPIRNRLLFSTNTSIAWAASISLVLLTCVAFTIQINGARSRFSDELLEIAETPYAGHSSGATGNEAIGWTLPTIGDSRSAVRAKFVLWGDSHAKCLSKLVNEVAARHGVKGFDAGLGGTPPLLGTWTRTEGERKTSLFNQFVLDTCRRENIEWIILAAAWDIHSHGLSKLRDDIDGDSQSAFQRGLERTIAAANAAGIKVAVIPQPPYQWNDVPVQVARAYFAGNTDRVFGVTLESHRSFQNSTRESFERFRNQLLLLDPGLSGFDCNLKLSLIGNRAVPYYSDAGHLTHAGVEIVYRDVIESFFSHYLTSAINP